MKLRGWRAGGAAFLAGALAALAMPPLYWLPLAVVGMVVFVWLWETASGPRSALLRGWAWGIGHFAVGSYWILEAFSVPPADYELLGLPIVAGLSAILGFFPGLAAGTASWAVLRWPRLAGRYRRLILLAIAWTVAEWLRGHVFTGYPWNPLGHVWAFATPLLQGAALFGVYGLGAFTFLALAAPTAGWRASVAALVAIGLAGAAGQAIVTPAGDGGPLIRIVQPNIPQSEKWRPDTRARHLAKLVEMSRRDGFDRLAAVIWPETAPPFVIDPASPALEIMATAVPPGGYLLTGAARGTERRQDGVWNSLLVIDGAGAIVAHYDKVHLVPLGEYIPFHKQLAPVSGFIGRGSFEEGEQRMTLGVPNLPSFSPVICYEVIFPAAVTGPGERPRWLLNITNDAWFGLSSGPYQHLTSARLRAVEEGLPMIRAANTGVSAVIDAYGRVLASLDMMEEGIIDHRLPQAREPTPYGRWGDGILLAVLALLAGGMLVGRASNNRLRR
ncbi:MAG: apolipoprotein N-acyltransferase [Alphaproteobacteria bacterium RIFCSPHIGHO2_12_FULL_66_14]|jgi:apolipoprotein N-acyltransferase|nr:MAG: apolipoprotein N-acyltransferase [Alphaproteobacteria bacterium RIFCSPHIGHO2_12_FULL_66_14]